MKKGRTVFIFSIFTLLATVARAEEHTLITRDASERKNIAHPAAPNEATLGDTFNFYLWLRENDGCVLCEPDREKRSQRVGEALKKLKTDGTPAQKKTAERLLRAGADEATSYLTAIEKARRAGRQRIAEGATTFDKNRPDVFVDQLLAEKSAGDIAINQPGAIRHPKLLGGRVVETSGNPSEDARRSANQQDHLDVENATHTWSILLGGK